MKFLSNSQIEKIINLHYGGEGIFRFWDSILDYYPQLNYDDCKEEFLGLIKFLIENNIIQLVGTFESNQKIWNGETAELLKKLKSWFPNENEWDYKTDSSWKMYTFDFPFIKWLKDYPIHV